MATPSRGWRLKRDALAHAPDLVLDEAKGSHTGLLAGVALDNTVAKDATVSKPGTAQTITPPANMALAGEAAAALASYNTTGVAKEASVGAIPAAVLDRALSEHTTAGTAGKALSDIEAGVGVGPGGVATIVLCQVSGVPKDGVEVWITTDEEGANTVAGPIETDALGKAEFMLDAGAYFTWRQLAGYNFTNPTALTVT
jgi:hypothetical protein